MVTDSNPNRPASLCDDAMLTDSEFLTAEETIRRRYRRIIQLSRVYKDHYWALVADLRSKYRDYIWNFGSPLLPDASDDFAVDRGKIDAAAAAAESIRCAHSHNCTRKPMPMTKFCHSHILSDPRQVLYKPCAYVTSRSGSTVQTVCAKPILRSTSPSFCNYHLLRAKKSVARSLKQAGLSTIDSNRMAPLIHIIGAEFVHEILRKRRTSKKPKGYADKMEEGAK